MALIWRRLREDDLPGCLAVSPAHLGANLVGRERAIAGWNRLVRSASFHAALIEATPAIAGHQIVGFGASAFVTPEFAAEELARPQPGLNDRLIASLDSDRPVVLTQAQLRAANTRGGLDLVVLYGALRPEILTAEAASEAYVLMSSSFIHEHMGYRINRLMVEVVDNAERRALLATHLWRIVSSFQEFHLAHPENAWSRGRALAVMTREEVVAVPGSDAFGLFHHREPVLRLRDADQQLLAAALTDSTDVDLSIRLGLRLPTVKKRWLSLFQRMAGVRPDLVPDGANLDGGGRGPQKRHRLLAYVRAHPEELRPIERDHQRRKRRELPRATVANQS
jgi:hypothetical protein